MPYRKPVKWRAQSSLNKKGALILKGIELEQCSFSNMEMRQTGSRKWKQAATVKSKIGRGEWGVGGRTEELGGRLRMDLHLIWGLMNYLILNPPAPRSSPQMDDVSRQGASSGGSVRRGADSLEAQSKHQLLGQSQRDRGRDCEL